MSSFTQFNAELHIQFSQEASDKLKGDYWVLTKEFTYFINSLDSNKFVTVPKGFLSDGASVPKLLRFLIDTMGRHSQAAILHDYLTETYLITIGNPGKKGNSAKSIKRKEIDNIFYEALGVLSVPKVNILAIKVAVDLYRFIARPSCPRVNGKKLALEHKYKLQLED